MATTVGAIKRHNDAVKFRSFHDTTVLLSLICLNRKDWGGRDISSSTTQIRPTERRGPIEGQQEKASMSFWPCGLWEVNTALTNVSIMQQASRLTTGWPVPCSGYVFTQTWSQPNCPVASYNRNQRRRISLLTDSTPSTLRATRAAVSI